VTQIVGDLIAFEDLVWRDVLDDSRTLFVAHFPNKQVLKWSVVVDHPSTGATIIASFGSLKRAVTYIIQEVGI
jgi:hypothetical protein